MKKKTKKFLAIMLSFCLISGISVTAFAKDDNSFNVNQYAAEELNTYAQEHGIGVVFDNFSITPVDDNMSDKQIETSVHSYVDMMKQALSNISTELVYKPNLTRAIGSYTASVESMIPAIGWGYIKQDFKANVSSSKISSVTLVGSSYDTGFTLGSWEPNYSWYDISNNKQFVQIHMKGTIYYLWKGLNISHSCTFLDTFKASGSKLVETTYQDWPD